MGGGQKRKKEQALIAVAKNARLTNNTARTERALTMAAACVHKELTSEFTMAGVSADDIDEEDWDDRIRELISSGGIDIPGLDAEGEEEDHVLE